MISKLRFSLIAVMMLVLVGFGFQNQAQAQVGLNGVFCPAVPHTTGWLETIIVGPGLVAPTFTGALVGTVEDSNGELVGGLDWHHVNDTSSVTPTPTNESGSQLVTWWTGKDRDTYLQVTNADSDDVNIHVVIFDENCQEIRNFCDSYTGYDTHEYDFANLVTNVGQLVTIPGFSINEGFAVVTAVENCDTSSEVAVDHNYLTGQTIIVDSDDYSYGVNTYARKAICFTGPDGDTNLINKIENGSFQDGILGAWDNTQGDAGVITENGIAPPVGIVPAQEPDASDPGADEFQGYVASTSDGGSGQGYQGGSFGNLATNFLINTGVAESNASVIESNVFGPPGDNPTATYDIAFLAPSSAILTGCDNYAAVLLVNTAGGGSIQDGDCYNNGGNGQINHAGGSTGCLEAPTNNIAYSINPFLFVGGISGFFVGPPSLNVPGSGNYVIQVVTAQVDDPQCIAGPFGTDTGAIVDNFRYVLTEDIIVECDGVLNGNANAMLDVVNPETLYAQFNVLPGNDSAGADVVHINFSDDYGPPYRPSAATSVIDISIFDDVEVPTSCGITEVCFIRLGIDDAIVNSDNVGPPVTPTPTPPPATPTPTPGTPTPVPPTPTPSGNGGSSSCAVAGSPVQLGTALANVLIPLVPVAFAFGVRAARRRKK